MVKQTGILAIGNESVHNLETGESFNRCRRKKNDEPQRTSLRTGENRFRRRDAAVTMTGPPVSP
jgi:hypothetical protein